MEKKKEWLALGTREAKADEQDFLTKKRDIARQSKWRTKMKNSRSVRIMPTSPPKKVRKKDMTTIQLRDYERDRRQRRLARKSHQKRAADRLTKNKKERDRYRKKGSSASNTSHSDSACSSDQSLTTHASSWLCPVDWHHTNAAHI